jgi:hypothetical protein
LVEVGGGVVEGVVVDAGIGPSSLVPVLVPVTKLPSHRVVWARREPVATAAAAAEEDDDTADELGASPLLTIKESNPRLTQPCQGPIPIAGVRYSIAAEGDLGVP